MIFVVISFGWWKNKHHWNHDDHILERNHSVIMTTFEDYKKESCSVKHVMRIRPGNWHFKNNSSFFIYILNLILICLNQLTSQPRY